MLVDLRESGSIEQDADVVMFIFREEYYLAREPTRHSDESEAKFNDRYEEWTKRLERAHGLSEIIIAKQRHGPIATIKLHFDAETTKFGNYVDADRLPAMG